MPTTIKIHRDEDKVPSQVEVTLNGRKTTVFYDQKIGFTFNRKPSSEVIELLRLIYPHQEKEVTPIMDIVTAEQNWINNSTQTVYTVPAGKRLRLISGHFCTSVIAPAATPISGYVFLWHSQFNAAMVLAWHYWNRNNQDVLETYIPEINYDWPGNSLIRIEANANARCTFTFIGVLK